MLMTLKESLDAAIEKTGRSARSVARDAGVPYDTIKNLRQGKSQSTAAETAAKIAGAFGVTLEEFRSGKIEPTATAIAPGLADQARPFIPQQGVDAARLLTILAPGVDQAVIWRTEYAAAWLGILKGDLLVLDMKRSPRPGEVVVAGIVDDVGDGQTLILRFDGSTLSSGEPGSRAIQVSAARIQGPVLALLRAPAVSDAKAAPAAPPLAGAQRPVSSPTPQPRPAPRDQVA